MINRVCEKSLMYAYQQQKRMIDGHMVRYRRYNKEGPNTMIFTSNIGPDKWGEFFSEDSTLLCALDRIFDEATVYLMKGDSYRGRKRETVSLETGKKKNK